MSGAANRQTTKTLDVRSRKAWRKWLERHHASESAIWLVFHKRHTPVRCMSYDDAVREALCFGWIDSIVKRLDDARYARKFTPRTAGSRWSTANRKRYADLQAKGLLAPPGLARKPTNRSGDAPKLSATAVPRFIEQRIRANASAWRYFESLAPSYRRAFIGWIGAAKREATREKRLREAIRLLASGQKLGLK